MLCRGELCMLYRGECICVEESVCCVEWSMYVV